MSNVFGVSSETLKQFIEKLERLELEKAEVMQVIRDTYMDVKSNGFDVKIVKQILKERKMDQSKLEEEETLLVMYKRALGMLPDLDE